MPLDIIRNDITKLEVDVIVNPSNPYLLQGNRSSVSGQIFEVAGKEALADACYALAPIPYGSAVLTDAYNLPAKSIIHVANPPWIDGDSGEMKLLAMTYRHALNLAQENNYASMAFPLLSAGSYGYPKEEAFQIAIHEIQDFVMKSDMLVYLVVYDKSVYEISKKLLYSVKDYLSEHLSLEPDIQFQMFEDESILSYHNKTLQVDTKKELAQRLKNKDISFSSALFKYIDIKEMSHVAAYKQANVSKAVFSKLLSNEDYRPSKSTALAFCIGLKLTMEESIDLLNKAGLSFSSFSEGDIIVQYFIENKLYDIMEINMVLYEYDQTLLGSNNQL